MFQTAQPILMGKMAGITENEPESPVIDGRDEWLFLVLRTGWMREAHA
jgi:hypothetical protein